MWVITPLASFTPRTYTKKSTMDLLPVFEKIETAVDAHPQLTRSDDGTEAELIVCRACWVASIWVKGPNKRKRPREIKASGSTPGDAANNLINELDFWAKSMA